MYDFDQYRLAETSELLTLATREENQLAVQRLAAQSQRTLALISRELDASLYNTIEFVEWVRRIALQNQSAEIRIVVAEPQLIVTRGHRLVDLAGRLSTYIQCRKLSEIHRNFGKNILVADAVGYFYRENEARFDAQINFNDRRQARALLERFNGIWQHAKPDSNLRRLQV